MSSRSFSLSQAPNNGITVLPDAGPGRTVPLPNHVMVVKDVVNGVVYTDYVDASIALAAVPEAPEDGGIYGRTNGAWLPVLPLTGGVLTGLLTLAQDPTHNLDAATKQYADSVIFRAGGPFLQLGGGTLSGPLVLHADPQNPLEAATRQYVDAVRTAIPGGAPVQSVAGRTGAIVLTHNDITDWTATLAPYALISQIPVGATALPLMDGTAAVGAGVAWARGDHVHPSDTSRLPLTGGTLSGPLIVDTTAATRFPLEFKANGGPLPTPDFGGALGFNYSTGAGEADFINLYPSAFDSFQFYQLTGAGAASLVAAISAAGILRINSVTLATDPPAAMSAATKQYVDARAWHEAPNNQLTYGRQALNWVPIGSHTSVGGGTFDPQTDIPAGYVGTYQITNQTGAAGWPAGNGAQTAFILAGFNSNTGWPNKLMMGGYRLANGEAPLWYSTNDNIWELVLTSAGGTLNTGKTITLGADPSAPMHAVTKQYFDAHAAGLTDAPNDGTAYGRVSAAWAHVLPLTGGTVAGIVQIGASSAGYLQLSPGNAASTGYVAFYNAAGVRQGYFGLAGSGFLNLALEDATHIFQVNCASLALTGHLGLGVGVPAGAAAPGGSGAWMFGWGITAGNWATNAYYGTDSQWHYVAAGVALVCSVGNGWSWIAAPNGSAGGVAAMTGKMSLDLSGNLNVAGTYTGANITVSTNVTGNQVLANAGTYFYHSGANNYVAYGDANNLYFMFESGYYWSWNRSSGALSWIGNNGTAMTLDYAGNLTLNGGVRPRNGQSVFGAGGNGVILQWSPSWYLDWNATNGTMTFVGPSQGLIWWDGSGNSTQIGACYATAYPGPSDARLKKNVQPWTDRGLAEIVRLQPVSFQFNGEGGLLDDGVTRYGVIAQDAEQFLPEAVHVMPDTSDRLAFDNGILLFAMVNAIKELAARVSMLELPA